MQIVDFRKSVEIVKGRPFVKLFISVNGVKYFKIFAPAAGYLPPQVKISSNCGVCVNFGG